jgi:hypothetical protein
MFKALRNRLSACYNNYMTAATFAQANDFEDALLLFSSNN